jgi:primosomal protein N' (replication factor Y) (superfamily II helicase)
MISTDLSTEELQNHADAVSPPCYVQVVLDKPLVQGFDYIWDSALLGDAPKPGQLVEVPFGRTNTVAIVIKVSNHSDYEHTKLKRVNQRAPLPPLDSKTLHMLNFASQYYFSTLGEIALPSIPAYWKKPKKWQTLAEKAIGNELQPAKKTSRKKVAIEQKPHVPELPAGIQKDQLNADQTKALNHLMGDANADRGYRAILLQGKTGSGKTAVYLNWIRAALQSDNDQALILVPEINLTPQLEKRVAEFFPDKRIAVMHSGLTEKRRGIAWQETTLGKAQIILGTRLAALAAIPNLKAIVVDEEHDASYKQQEGTRYSARDLCVWRAHQLSIPIVLASATPSLETWLAAEDGRYERIRLDARALSATMPKVKLVRLSKTAAPSRQGEADLISTEVRDAITRNLLQKKQSLVLINRRGYAPILSCTACGWLSGCSKCSSYMVIHKSSILGKKAVLNCHHCGLIKEVPPFCPECGNAELSTIGQGTQKMEDYIQSHWPAAKVLRIDADSSKKSAHAEGLFEQIHDGTADIIVGTQMVAKGHDYQNIGLVAVIDADSRLFSQDYRAAERLFAQLVQVAGRAGRASQEQEDAGEICIETRYPDLPVFRHVLGHDVDGFLGHIAAERKDALLPPYSYQALIHAEAKNISTAIQFLTDIKKTVRNEPDFPGGVRMYDPVPKTIVRVSNMERAQLVIESDSRKNLQQALTQLDQVLRGLSQGRISVGSRVRWLIERDPLLI